MSARPTHWPRWSRAWGPAWAGWWHIPREERQKIAADPQAYRDSIEPDLLLPNETRELTVDEYRCSMCRGVFTKAWSDEEADAERLALWGDVAEKDCAVVCDPCFKRMGLGA